MIKDTFVRAMLVIIAALLLLNLLNHGIIHLISPVAIAENNCQDIAFGSRIGSSIACSSDGKYVYATDGSNIYRSLDYGKVGTWEGVAK